MVKNKKINTMSIKELRREKKKLTKKLAPHFEGQPLVNKVWHEYNEGTPLGKLLKRKDKVCIQLYKMENGGNGQEKEPFKGSRRDA